MGIAYTLQLPLPLRPPKSQSVNCKCVLVRGRAKSSGSFARTGSNWFRLFFLSLESNASLLHKANCVNINLGIDESSSCHNIDIMKEIELKNRTDFLDKNPEVSLPVNLDVGVNSELFPSLNSSSKGTDNPPFKDNNNSATKSWAKVLTDGLEASNNQMIGVVWNIRGLNKRGKLQCIADFIFYNKIDFVSFQETKKKKPLMIPFWGMSIGTLFGIASLQLVQ